MLIDERQRRKTENQRSESPEIEQLIAQRERMLREDPHLRELQHEIDTLLGVTLDPMIRLEILSMLMMDKLNALQDAWADVAQAMDVIKSEVYTSQSIS